ncbi:hypothetical protein STENM223S_07585 [Streptomyces tendae]
MRSTRRSSASSGRERLATDFTLGSPPLRRSTFITSGRSSGWNCARSMQTVSHPGRFRMSVEHASDLLSISTTGSKPAASSPRAWPPAPAQISTDVKRRSAGSGARTG